MYCKKCGNILNDSLYCEACGFQNTIDTEDIVLDHEESVSGQEKSNVSNKENLVKTHDKRWLVLAIISFITAVYPLYKGYDKMTNYYNSEGFPSLNTNAYVGGDAYNYIINAGYATAFFVLAVGFALLGVGFIIVYYLSDRKA